MKRKSSKLLGATILLSAMAATCVAYATVQNLQSPAPGGGEDVIATGGPVTLGNEPIQFQLQGKKLAASLGALAPNQRIHLVLRELYASQQPGVLYHVLLDLPPGAIPEKSDIHFVGILNFYNAVPLESGAAGPNTRIFSSFDVTAVARNLQQRKVLTDQTTITIVPSGVPAAGARVSIGRIELIEQ